MTPDAGTPRILLVDCDMFFVQVARLEDPEGLGRVPLLIVGGSPSGRGVVTSASYACREYGVRSGMPAARARQLCPGATFAPVDREAVSRRSRSVRESLEGLAPVVEAASVDEFYLDLTGTERLFGGEPLEATARRIREAVLAETSVSVSVGGATRKYLAKMATRRAKPAGVYVIPPGGEAAFLSEHELADLPGVGPALAADLRKRGLVRIPDLLPVEEGHLVDWYGEARGRWLFRRARGEDDSPVAPGQPARSISSERTFSRDLDDDEELEAVLLKLTRSVTRSLRRQSFRARTVTVKVRTGDFTTRTASHTVPEPLETDHGVYPVAVGLLRELRGARRRPLRLLGVGLSNLVPPGEDAGQLTLFEGGARGESDRDRELSRAVDSLRERFGDDAVLPGRILGRGDRGTGNSPAGAPEPTALDPGPSDDPHDP